MSSNDNRGFTKDIIERLKSLQTIEEKDIPALEQLLQSSNPLARFSGIELIDKISNQEKRHMIAKQMLMDGSSLNVKTMLQSFCEYWIPEDYDLLLDLSLNAKKDIAFFAIYYLENMVYDLDLDDVKWEADLKKIAERRREKKVKFMLQASEVLLTWEYDSFKKLGHYLYDSSSFLRLWAVNIYEDVMDLTDPGEEEVEWMHEILHTKLQKGDRVREIRIYVDKAYKRLSRELLQEEECERDFAEEFELEERLSEKIEHDPEEQDILSYAIVHFYYPFTDLKHTSKILWDYGNHNHSKKCMILGCFYNTYYSVGGRKEKNRFLTWLMKHKKELTTEEQLLAEIMEAVGVGLQGDTDDAMKLLKSCLQKDTKCVAIYDEITYFGNPYSNLVREARKKIKQLQKKLSLQELENVELEKRMSYDFFMEMEIKKNIQKPRGYEQLK